MKLNETGWNSPPNKEKSMTEEMGDDHIAGSANTPLRPDAFELDDEIKIELIAKHFKEIMQVLGLDLEDDSLKGTPQRVAKMYVKEIFSGLNPKNMPEARMFENRYQYNQMLVERDITFHSSCEHHFVPIIGRAHVGYISSGKVIGLSKINRIVQHFAKRPQVQERMTVQIAEALKEALQTEHVAVVVDAAHLCVQMRGIQDINSRTVTSQFLGKFKEDGFRQEFLKYIE